MLAFLRNHWSRHLLITLLVFSAFSLALCVLSELGQRLYMQGLTANEAAADEKYLSGEQAIERQDYEGARKQLGEAIATYRELIMEWSKTNDRTIDSWSAHPQRPRPDFPVGKILQYHKSIGRVKSKLAKALTKRGFAYSQKDYFSNALTDLNEAIKLDSENPQAFEVRAKVNRALGQERKADEDEGIARALREKQAQRPPDAP